LIFDSCIHKPKSIQWNYSYNNSISNIYFSHNETLIIELKYIKIQGQLTNKSLTEGTCMNLIKTRNITTPRGIVWRTGVLHPPLVLGAFNLDPSPCPQNHHPLNDIHLHYKWFLFSSFALSVSLFARNVKCLRIGGGIAPGGGNIFQHFFT